MSGDDFYVGYLPKSPESQGRFTRKIVLALLLFVAAVAGSLMMSHQKLPTANFDFDKVHRFSGMIEIAPYPTLIDGPSRYLLVAPGKHGADELVREYAGKDVNLEAKMIYRDDQKMLEVVPGSVKATSFSGNAGPAEVELGSVTLIGEIVDSKCYSGVMNPGSGKVHRDCAARCISGGIPPLFLAKDRNGATMLYQLARGDGKPLSKEALPRVAEPVTIEGNALRRGNALLLYARKITPIAEGTIRSWSCPRRKG